MCSRRGVSNDYKFTLIEAGNDYKGQLRAALQSARYVPMKGHAPEYDQQHDWGLNVDGINIPQARVRGGSSAINGSISLIGSSCDYDERAKLAPSSNWHRFAHSLRQVEETFPLHIAGDDELGALQRAFVESGQRAGFSRVQDFNDGHSEGIGAVPVARTGSFRQSTAARFLDPVRSKVQIKLNTSVDHLLFSGDKAVGAVATNKGRLYADTVVLCAGAIQTPAILQRSGIGPTDVLEPLGISVKVDLPVGKNFLDHPSVSILVKPKEGA